MPIQMHELLEVGQEWVGGGDVARGLVHVLNVAIHHDLLRGRCGGAKAVHWCAVGWVGVR